jgi:hypothetical protein
VLPVCAIRGRMVTSLRKRSTARHQSPGFRPTPLRHLHRNTHLVRPRRTRNPLPDPRHRLKGLTPTDCRRLRGRDSVAEQPGGKQRGTQALDSRHPLSQQTRANGLVQRVEREGTVLIKEASDLPVGQAPGRERPGHIGNQLACSNANDREYRLSDRLEQLLIGAALQTVENGDRPQVVDRVRGFDVARCGVQLPAEALRRLREVGRLLCRGQKRCQEVLGKGLQRSCSWSSSCRASYC